jgi:hypothetical protein
MISYTVILNSHLNGTGATNDKTYQFDFSSWEEGAYKLTWTYVGEADVLAAVHTCSVFANLGTTTVFNTGGTNYANTTQQIGTLRDYSTGGAPQRGNYLYADTNSNTPIYMHHRPMNQTIEIRLLDEAGNLWLDANVTPLPPGDYILKLNFERV